jgi:membrane protein YdbS with pleckstrin-like domain
VRQPELLRPRRSGEQDPYLLEGEEALLTIRQHGFVLWRDVLQTLGVWVVGLAFLGWVPGTGLESIIGLILIAALVRFVWQVVQWRYQMITLSDKRLFIIRGVFNRRLSMMPLRKVTDLTLIEPLLGRLLRFGTIVVESAGQNQALSDIPYIPNPRRFYRLAASLGVGSYRPRRPADDTMTLDDF